MHPKDNAIPRRALPLTQARSGLRKCGLATGIPTGKVTIQVLHATRLVLRSVQALGLWGLYMVLPESKGIYSPVRACSTQILMALVPLFLLSPTINLTECQISFPSLSMRAVHFGAAAATSAAKIYVALAC
ncbi:hypothetical protein RhiLY_06551 [Ceratobasidium sp. AG-Ba]|nr:hypothetical protein RhiLY_06551 [Ceratobasidium sp. AG-Ba]